MQIVLRVVAAALAFAACAASAQGTAEFDAARKPLDEQRAAAEKLRNMDRRGYVEAYRAYLVAAEKVVKRFPNWPPAQRGLRGDVVSGYLQLGHFARYQLKDPQLALSLYDARIDGEPSGLAEAAAADTYQFDLNDKRAALTRYRALMQRTAGMTSANDLEAGILRFTGPWLRHQVAWLESGKRFSGSLAADECGGAMVLLMYGQSVVRVDDLGLGQVVAKANAVGGGRAMNDADRKALAVRLMDLPSSSLALLTTARLASLLPDAHEIRFFFDRNDPAGYASACFFAEADRLSRLAADRKGVSQVFPGLALDPPGAANPLAAAASRFVADRGIVRAEPDARMSTPEKTWALFVESLKANDLEAAKRCATPAMHPVLIALAQGGLKSIGESFTGFAMMEKPSGGMAEGVVTRGGKAGVVSFVNVGGAWKIASM